MKLIQGDCLEVMKDIPDGSVDMILCDLPYGTTSCKWDSIIPFEPLWEQYNRIIKDNGAIVLFGREPFSTLLRYSNLKMYKYDWVWEKTRPQRFVLAKKMPLSSYETLSVFYKKLPRYNPQMREGKPYTKKYKNSTMGVFGGEDKRKGTIAINTGVRYPIDIIEFSNGNHKSYHPTQKPVALLEYLIKTYTNEGELVLDNCMGSGSTGVACKNTNRDFIGIELDEKYFNIAKSRIELA